MNMLRSMLWTGGGLMSLIICWDVHPQSMPMARFMFGGLLIIACFCMAYRTAK